MTTQSQLSNFDWISPKASFLSAKNHNLKIFWILVDGFNINNTATAPVSNCQNQMTQCKEHVEILPLAHSLRVDLEMGTTQAAQKLALGLSFTERTTNTQHPGSPVPCAHFNNNPKRTMTRLKYILYLILHQQRKENNGTMYGYPPLSLSEAQSCQPSKGLSPALHSFQWR